MTVQTLSRCMTLLKSMQSGQEWSDGVEETFTIVLQPMTDDLGMAIVHRAVRTRRWRPSPAELVEMAQTLAAPIPTADEAWARIPRDEGSTVVWTEEMAIAMSSAQPLLDEGDQIAARMAFKAHYDRLVEQMRAEGRAPKWVISLGWNPHGRVAPISEAISQGLISHEAMYLLPEADQKQLERGMIQKSLEPGPERKKAISFAEAKRRGLVGPETLKQLAASKAIPE